MKDQTITLNKSTFDIMCNLLSLAAIGCSTTFESIARDCSIMKDMEYKNADYFNKTIMESAIKGAKITNLLFDSIPSDDEEVLSLFDEIGQTARYKKMLKDWGADMVANGNFDNLKRIES